MKRIALSLAAVAAIMAASALASAQDRLFSAQDQAVVERAVDRVERLVDDRGEDYRGRIVAQLRYLAGLYPDDERVERYLPRVIHFAEHPDSVSYPVRADVACTKIYQPVCGVDHVTYGNSCEAESAALVEIAHTGSCEDAPIACTMEYAPVCGEDGVTYSNSCMARAAGTEVESSGECSGM